MLRIFLALIALSCLAVYWTHIRISSEDEASYQELLAQSSQIRDKRFLKDTAATQVRRGVQKQIWSENETHHLSLRSDSSTLNISQENNHIAIVETLQNLDAELPNGSFLKADTGIYTFPSHQFIAKEHCRFIQEHNDIHSEEMHFDLAKRVLTCAQAKGTLSDGFHFEANKLTWDKKQGTLIEGFGDVHFSITLDEQNLIDTLFRQYL